MIRLVVITGVLIFLGLTAQSFFSNEPVQQEAKHSINGSFVKVEPKNNEPETIKKVLANQVSQDILNEEFYDEINNISDLNNDEIILHIGMAIDIDNVELISDNEPIHIGDPIDLENSISFGSEVIHINTD